jgi:hypothetical protein
MKRHVRKQGWRWSRVDDVAEVMMAGRGTGRVDGGPVRGCGVNVTCRSCSDLALATDALDGSEQLDR